MDMNGDGQHDWRDDALLYSIIEDDKKRSTLKEHPVVPDAEPSL